MHWKRSAPFPGLGRRNQPWLHLHSLLGGPGMCCDPPLSPHALGPCASGLLPIHCPISSSSPWAPSTLMGDSFPCAFLFLPTSCRAPSFLQRPLAAPSCWWGPIEHWGSLSPLILPSPCAWVLPALGVQTDWDSPTATGVFGDCCPATQSEAWDGISQSW